MVSKEEFTKRREELEKREEKKEAEGSGEAKKKKKKKKAAVGSALSFGDDEEPDCDEPPKKKLGKNPSVDSSFLPDKERDEADAKRREVLAEEYRKQVEELIAVAKQNEVRPVLVTIPVQGNDVANELSLKLRPYNDLLREVARAKRIPLADINRLMTERYKADPELALTFDGERFSHQGAMLMAESVMRAMGLETMITPRLRKTWAETPSYTKTR